MHKPTLQKFVGLFLLSLFYAQSCLAIREGTANATIFIKQYEQRGEWDKVALWQEAAAECLTRISLPMNEIAHGYYTRHGHEKWAARAKKERAEILAQRQAHLKRAETAWRKFFVVRKALFSNHRADNVDLSGRIAVRDAYVCAERQKIAKFMATWAPQYPNRFYDFGIYPTFFRALRERAEEKKDIVKVLQLEADAAEMCAAQYEKMPIALGLKRYEKVRDAYHHHAMLLRALAKQHPKTLPPEADRGKQLVHAFIPPDTGARGPSRSRLQKRACVAPRKQATFNDDEPSPVGALSKRAKSEAILQTAKSAARVKKALRDKNGIHAYARFQGFAWTVSFYNHSRGNLAIVIIDDKTGEVLDVLIFRTDAKRS